MSDAPRPAPTRMGGRWRVAGATAPWWWQLGVTVVVGLFLLAILGSAWASAVGPSVSPVRVLDAVLDMGGVAALAVRRRLPFTVLAIEVALATWTALQSTTVEHSGAALLVVVSAYVVATLRPPARTIAAVAGAALVIGAATWAHASDWHELAPLLPDLAFLTTAVAVGFAVRAQRTLLQTFRERAEQAEREQRWAAVRAVAEERVRLARELHDVVAHHVSLLVVQAGAVRETLPSDHLTRPVLDSMIDGGRRAMSELREMLGALRLDERGDEAWSASQNVGAGAGTDAGPSPAPGGGVPGLPRAPQPTIDMVPGLAGGANAAGLPVTLQVEGTPLDLPATISLSAYRVVQEALTNVMRHAPGAFTTVALRYGVEVLEVDVRNGPSPGAGRLPNSSHQPGAPRGHGLMGMRERAAQAGGTLTAGPVGDGWEVRARFPIGPVSTLPDTAMSASP